MDEVGPRAYKAPEVIVRPCRGAMYGPRVRTVQDLLRHTYKISEPRPSPVVTDGARMQGPGVKEECHNCAVFVPVEELQQCSACGRGFHTTCLDPPVHSVTPRVSWCCGLCGDYKSREDNAGATGRISALSMASSENLGGQWVSTASSDKKKLTDLRELKEVVQQEKSGPVNSQSLPTASFEGEASKSKRGRPIRSYAQALFSKRRRIDSRIFKLNHDDGNSPSNVPEQSKEVEEMAVEFKGAPVEGLSRLSINPPASIRVADLVPEIVSYAVVSADSNHANVDSVGSRASPITEVDKAVQLRSIKIGDSDATFKSLAMKDISTESSAGVALARVPGFSMVEVVKSEEFDASHKVLAEIKLQGGDFDTHSGHLNDYRQALAAEVETIPLQPSTTLLRSSQNVGDVFLKIVVEQEGQALVVDQQVKEQGCTSDSLCSGKAEDIAAAGAEYTLSENSQRHAFDPTGKVKLGPSMGLSSSPSSLINSPPSVKDCGPSPPFNSFCLSVSTTSSISSASPFEGFQSQSKDIITFTSPVTSQLSKPALQQSVVDGRISSVAIPPFQASGSTSTPTSTSSVIKTEKGVLSVSSPCVEDKPQPVVSLSQSLVARVASPTDVNIPEAVNSPSFKLVSGLPLPAQRARKGSQSSLPILEVNGFLAQPGRKFKAQIMDLPQLVLVHPSRASKELSGSSMRDQEPLKSDLPKSLVNDFSTQEPDDALSGKCVESNADDDRDGLLSNLLVEDVKVCDTCGNAGYEDLLALCSSCNEGAEHTYCMRIQMDSLPGGDWFCETCQLKQRRGGSKTLERLLVSSKSLGRSTSVNSRPKPLSIQGSSRSRLVDRLNNKKSLITPVRKSPCKTPASQNSVKRLQNDSVASPVSRKLATESSSWAVSFASSPSTMSASTPSAKSSPTREKTYRSAGDTAKVKFLAPSAVSNFLSGARATATMPASVASQLPKAAAVGQAGNKSRFASLSSISESSTPSNKATNLSSSHASLTASPTPILSKSLSGKISADFSILSKSSTAKLSADFPSFLLNSNSREGNGLKCSEQFKNSRDGCVPDGVSMYSSGSEKLLSASQPSGSKLMRLGRNTGNGVTGQPRPSPDTPRSILESGRSAQRLGQTGEPRPFLDSLRPPLDYGRGTHRSGPGIGGSNVAGTGQDASKIGSKDKASSRSEPALGVELAGSGRIPFEPASVPGFPGKQSKLSTSMRSAPWLGDSSPTRCFSCKSVGHIIQDCRNHTSLASEQKASSGLSNSPGTSPKPPKNSVLAVSDTDANEPAVEFKAGLQEKVNLSNGLQIAIQSVPGGCSSESEKSKSVLRCRIPANLVRRSSSNVKIQDSSVAGSKTPSFLNGSSLPQLVTAEAPGAVSSVANGDSSSREGLRVVSGAGSTLWTSGGVCDNEGPPVVFGSETAYVHSKVAASQNNISPPVISESSSSPNASQATGPKVPHGHVIQLTEATISPVSQGLQRVHPAWGPRPPWLEAQPPHAVQGQGPGHVGYLSGLVQSFPSSGPVIYGQGPSMSYLTSQPPPPLSPCAPFAPPQVSSRTPPPLARQIDAAVPSAAIAWRGAFEVNDGKSTFVFDEILAHVSTKAVAKVHEVATSLPQQLRLEQVQRATDLETWPRQFNLQPPTDGSIALYFFATNGESFEKFRHNLVDKMVAQDLVLRAHVDDAELLIFPSDKLSDKFQRWRGHIFLWGVFRARKQAVKTASTSTIMVEGPLVADTSCIEISKAAPVFKITPKMKDPNSSNSGCDNTEEVDMEVDMEGGKECCVSNKPIKRDDSAYPPSTPPLFLTGASIRAPTASVDLSSAPEYLILNSDDADNVQRKPAFIKTEDLDLPPGFAPALALPSAPMASVTLTLDLTLPRGVTAKTEAQKQADVGSSADAAEDPEQEGSKLKRSVTSLELLKNSSTSQTSPLSTPSSKENAESNLPSLCPSTTKRSRSKSRSPSRPKLRSRLCERVKDRERRDLDSRLERHDRSRERGREVYRDRDRDRDYEKEKDGHRLRSRDRDRERDTYDWSKGRARPTDKDRVKERGRARERDRKTLWERDRDRERETEKEWERERHFARGKDRRSFRPRDSDQDLDSRIRCRRSRSRSPSRRKLMSRSPGADRRKPRSRTPPRHRIHSPSLSRRHLSSYRQLSVSGSDSPDSQSLVIMQGSTIAGSRSRKADRESVEGMKRVTADRDGADKALRFSYRWKSSRPVDDARSGSAGASNSRTVGNLGHLNTVPVSRSVTPVLDMNEGVSEAFSVEGAAVSTSLPDLNTDSVESGVAFHDFLPADERGPSMEPETASPIAERTFFSGVARTAVTPSLSARLNFRSQDAEPILARERWGFIVSSLGSCSDYISRSSSRYQFLRPSILEGSINNPNPDLELALGGRETASPERAVPLPLFFDGRTRSSDLGFSLNAKSADWNVGLSTPRQLGPPSMVCGGTASLSLSLAVPQYRREGNSWVQVEERGDVSDRHDVDFSLTL